MNVYIFCSIFIIVYCSTGYFTHAHTHTRCKQRVITVNIVDTGIVTVTVVTVSVVSASVVHLPDITNSAHTQLHTASGFIFTRQL